MILEILVNNWSGFWILWVRGIAPYQCLLFLSSGASKIDKILSIPENLVWLIAAFRRPFVPSPDSDFLSPETYQKYIFLTFNCCASTLGGFLLFCLWISREWGKCQLNTILIIVVWDLFQLSRFRLLNYSKVKKLLNKVLKIKAVY